MCIHMSKNVDIFIAYEQEYENKHFNRILLFMYQNKDDTTSGKIIM